MKKTTTKKNKQTRFDCKLAREKLLNFLTVFLIVIMRKNTYVISVSRNSDSTSKIR